MNSAPSLVNLIQSHHERKLLIMDETNVNGIEVEDTEALIPEGWDGKGDFFDDASWSDGPVETSAETEAKDSEPEVDLTTVEEEPAEEPVQEDEAPTTETEEPVAEETSRKLKFKAKVDHNDLDIELDESDLPDVYQKAQVVDRVQSQMGKMKGTVERATKLAKGMGFENADDMLIAAAKNHLQNEIDRLVNDEEHPVNPLVAQDIIERRLGYTMKELEDLEVATPEEPSTEQPQETPKQGRDISAEVTELITAHPELAGTAFPSEVAKKAMETGERIVDVYNEYVKNNQVAKIQDLVKENQVLKQNAETAQRAPVIGVTGHGIEGNEPDDPFMEGFNSQAW